DPNRPVPGSSPRSRCGAPRRRVTGSATGPVQPAGRCRRSWWRNRPVPGRWQRAPAPGWSRRQRGSGQWSARAVVGSSVVLVGFAGPAVGVAGLDLAHHPLKGLVQVDALAIGQADQHEQYVGHLHRDVALGLVALAGLLAVAMVDLAGELPHLLAEPGEVGERMEVAFLVLGDPRVDAGLML